VQTELESSDPADQLVLHQTEPLDRVERQIEALQRMYGRFLEDENRLGVNTLKEIDAALRGEPSRE
jgi:hypothetical protein